MNETKWLAGLVRAVARDGSVWWVKPEQAAEYEQIESAIMPCSEETRRFHDAAQQNYWRKDRETK